MAILSRYEGNPVLEPRPQAWDAVSVFNPGAILREGRVHMLYRAVSDIGRYVSRFGLAVSEDGRRFRRACEEPVFEPQADYEVGGVEDARITRDGDDFLVTYAAVSVVPGPVYEGMDFFRVTREDPYAERPGIPPLGPSFTGLLRTRDFRSFTQEGLLTPPGLDDRDGVLFPQRVGGRYAMLHRPSSWVGEPYGTAKPSIWLAFSDDLRAWDYGQGPEYLLLEPQAPWEGAKVGAGPPPIRTDAGWLVLYHGVDRRYVYRVGAALLDLDDPLKVLARTPEPLLEPREEWERVGIIPNVVFPTAAVPGPDGELLVYYGAADRVVGLATADVGELLDHLLG
ncbi:MAG: glycosidase [Candidatus Brocadiia bacterium]